MALTLKGIPLNKLVGLTKAQQLSPAFTLTQQLFDEQRGPGTPLLGSPLRASLKGPAPYIRVTLNDMLIRHVNGEDPRPINDDESRAAAEAHLALIEVVAEHVSAEGRVRDFPVLPVEVRPVRFGVRVTDRPEWTSHAVLESLTRVLLASRDVDTTFAPDRSVSRTALDRLSNESVHWQAQSPFGESARDGIEKRANALRLASASDPKPFDEVLTEVKLDPLQMNVDDWERVARERMASTVAASLPGDNPPLTADSLKAGVMSKFIDAAKRDAEGQPTFIVHADSVQTFLKEFDVMVDYGFQAV